jgi:hypothetical protein
MTILINKYLIIILNPIGIDDCIQLIKQVNIIQNKLRDVQNLI